MSSEGPTIADALDSSRMPFDDFVIHVTAEPLNPIAFCPLCLHRAKKYDFMRTLRSGKPSRKCKCRECGKEFYLASLLLPSSKIKNYARWVFEYPWQERKERFSWEKMMQRLKQYGIASVFWDEYHRLKALAPPRSD